MNSDDGRAKHESGFQIFVMILVHFFLPVLNIYPAVYIWYDYMTDEQLAYSPQEKGYLMETANIAIQILIATKIMQHFFSQHIGSTTLDCIIWSLFDTH